MQFLDAIFGQLFVLFRQSFEIVPIIRIEEVHQIEKFSNIVVQRRLDEMSVLLSPHKQITYPSHDDALCSIELLQLLEDQARIALHCGKIRVNANTVRIGVCAYVVGPHRLLRPPSVGRF